jgi:hypothetical protein
MKFESLEQLKNAIENPVNKDFIIRANQIRVKHELHVSGRGLDSYIDKIQGIENDNAKSLRRALGKTITESESQRLISPQNKIFSARGGGRFYDFSNDRDKQNFIEILSDVKSGKSLGDYMRKVWKELVNVDPSGIIFTEIDENSELFLSYKSSESFHDIVFTSSTKIEYIIFKPFNDDKGNKYYRVVDDAYDYLIKSDGKSYSIVEDETFENPWGFVPATFISDRIDRKSGEAFNSHINEAMNHADDLLLDYTIYKVYKTRIGIPLHWQYERECATCEGSGQVEVKNEDGFSTEKCGYCAGTGASNSNRDVADIFILRIPESDDVPVAPPAGYVVPDLESWSKMEETMKETSNKMYESVWGAGATIEGDRRNITASELTVRNETKIDKLNEVSDNEETVEKRITDIIALYHFPNTYNGSIVNNGRHFDVKTTEQLQDEYNESLEKEVSSTLLTEILEDLYHTLYRRSPQRLNESIIKLYSKPFFHWQPEKLQQINIDIVDYYKNVYYDEFVVWYENNIEKFGTTTLEKVNDSLDKWIVEKLPKESINQKVEENE